MSETPRIAVGRSNTPPLRLLTTIAIVTIGAAYFLLSDLQLWFGPKASAASGIRVALLVIFLMSIVGLVMMVLSFLGFWARDTVVVLEQGVKFITPSGKESLVAWDDSRYRYVFHDYRKRPQNFIHGYAGIRFTVAISTKRAWIDEQAYAQITSACSARGWVASRSEVEKRDSKRQWIERTVTFWPPRVES